MDALKRFRKTLKKLMHRIRVGGAILVGSKASKMSKIVESSLYELRLLTLVTVGILIFYIFDAAMDNPDKSPTEQLIIEMNIGILIIIISLILIVVTKLNKTKYQCGNPEHEHLHCESDHLFSTAPDCHKTCKHINPKLKPKN